MRPSCTIQSKDTISQEWVKLPMSIPQAEIIELRGQQCFDILRLNCPDDMSSKHLLSECISIFLMLLNYVVEPSLLSDCLSQFQEAGNAEESR
jgi:hypothetical protein